VTPPEIRITIEELRTRTRPEQRSTYERALLALVDLVDLTTSAIDGQVMRGMTQRQFDRIHDLRAAIPHRFPPMPKDPT
jgi:hypothetical protein